MHSRKRDIEKSLVAEFIIPDWGDRVNSSIGCRTVPSRQDTFTGGRVQQPYVGVDSIPQSGTMNLASCSIFEQKMSHGQKLSTTSGEPEFVAQKFFEIPTSDSSMPCTDREEKEKKTELEF